MVNRIAIIFDVNFSYTMEQILSNKYIEKYLKSLELVGNNKVIIEKMNKYANEYLKDKLKEINDL